MVRLSVRSWLYSRTGVYTVYRPITIILNPKNKKISKYINAYGIGMEGSDVSDLKGKRLDTEQPVFLFLNTPAEGELSGGYYMAYTYLYEPLIPPMQVRILILIFKQGLSR
ncbi:MAG: hypothetical protein IPH28_23250 [Cytophagaceae bacterium]|nr:hypothetical protein [Cytophagaceae bacterium]